MVGYQNNPVSRVLPKCVLVGLFHEIKQGFVARPSWYWTNGSECPGQIADSHPLTIYCRLAIFNVKICLNKLVNFPDIPTRLSISTNFTHDHPNVLITYFSHYPMHSCIHSQSCSCMFRLSPVQTDWVGKEPKRRWKGEFPYLKQCLTVCKIKLILCDFSKIFGHFNTVDGEVSWKTYCNCNLL